MFSIDFKDFKHFALCDFHFSGDRLRINLGIHPSPEAHLCVEQILIYPGVPKNYKFPNERASKHLKLSLPWLFQFVGECVFFHKKVWTNLHLLVRAPFTFFKKKWPVQICFVIRFLWASFPPGTKLSGSPNFNWKGI